MANVAASTGYENELMQYEQQWAARYQFFKAQGFSLRPRYRPGWTPSWLTSGVSPTSCEDNVVAPVSLLSWPFVLCSI